MVSNLPTFKDPSFKKNVFYTIIEICTYNNYERISNYEWFVNNVLFVIARMKDNRFD